MITPSLRATISRATACAHRYTPLKLMAIYFIPHLIIQLIFPFGVFGITSRRGMLMPALFTNTSICPKAALAFSTIASTLSAARCDPSPHIQIFRSPHQIPGALGLMSSNDDIGAGFAKIPAPQPSNSGRSARYNDRFAFQIQPRCLHIHFILQIFDLALSLRLSRTPVCLSSRNCIVQSFLLFNI